jgi:hypothetical protein
MRAPTALFALLWGFAGLCQQAPSTWPPPAAEITGTFPAVLKVRARTASPSKVSLAESAKRPTNVAPSARAYGRSDFSTLPANLNFYTGLTESGNLVPQRRLDTLDARFEKDARVTVVLEITQGEVLLEQRLARRLGLQAEVGAEVELPPFEMGPVTFSRVTARVVGSWDMPSDSVQAVVPLSLFSGLGVLWEPAAERITLCRAGAPDAPASTPGAFAVPARCERGAVLLHAVLQEKVEGYFLLDPAQPHSAIDAAAARRAEVPMKPAGDEGKKQLMEGGVAEEARIRIGTARVTIRSVRVMDLARNLPEGCLGILGREAIEVFGYYFEPGACTVDLIPAKRP